MKIAIVRSCSSIISHESYNCQEIGLAEALLDYKISFDIYMAGNVLRPYIETLTNKNGHCLRLFLLPFIRLPGRQGLFPSLFKILKQEDYDLIQLHEDSQITSCIVSRYGKKRGIPVVLCQGMYENYNRFLARSLQIIYDIIFLKSLKRNVIASIAKTTKAKTYLNSKGFKNISICPIGLDTKQFEIEDIIYWRNNHNIPEESKVLLYVGIIEPRRNVDFLIRVFYELLKHKSDLYLLIAGDGPDENKCKQLVKHLSLSEKIIFLGKIHQKQLPSLYKTSDILLLPSSYEIYGMVFLEAMYFGLPVITTSTAGSEEIIGNTKSGIIIKNVKIDEWLKTILNLLSNPSLSESISFEAQKRVKELFLWEKAAKKFLNIYTTIHKEENTK